MVHKTNTIYAIDLRCSSSSLLDRADYQRQSFIIERADKPKAVVVPFSGFEQLQRTCQENRERYFASVNELREAFSDMSKEDIDVSIENAVRGVRKR